MFSDKDIDNAFTILQGESPLHTACRSGLANLTAELLQQGANPNLQTEKALPDDTIGVANQTPLHMAIAHNHPDVVSVILEQKGQYELYTFYCNLITNIAYNHVERFLLYLTTYLENVLKLPEMDLLIFPLLALLQPMHSMPPTTSRSFQTSVLKTLWTRQYWAWPCGQVHS